VSVEKELSKQWS